MAAETGCRAVADYREILGEVDAVSIATPTPLHYPIARTASSTACTCWSRSRSPRRSRRPAACRDWRRARARAAGRPPRALQRRDPRARGHARHAALRRVAPPRAVQGARHGRQRRARPDDPRHRPDPEPGRRADRRRSTRSAPRCSRPGLDIANARIRYANGCVANTTASRVSMKMERKLRLFQDDAYVSIDLQQKVLTIVRKPPRGSRCRAGAGRDRGAHLRAGRRAQARDRGVPAVDPRGPAAGGVGRGRPARARDGASGSPRWSRARATQP